MVIIRFDDSEAERRGLCWLAGRFSFKTWAGGDVMLHESALPHLARESLAFRVIGPATYEHFVPALQNADPVAP
jgi:hypothetical protein